MPDNETNNNSLVPIHNTGLIRVGNIIKITDKVLKEYSERVHAVFYKSVIIGEQEWMVENLNVDHFRNGDPIPEAKTDEDWIKAGEEQIPAWCYYDNDPENGKIYGKLYNWFAVDDPRGLAPEGWHIPSFLEYDTLIEFLGGEEIAGDKMKATNGWFKEDNGNNESGFMSLPFGHRIKNAKFLDVDYGSNHWCSNEYSTNSAWYLDLTYEEAGVLITDNDKKVGCSVRCLKNNNISINKDIENAKVYQIRGLKKYNEHNYLGAIDEFTKAIIFDSNYAEAYYHRGVSKRKGISKKEGINDFTKFIKFEPNNANAYFERGDAKFHLEDYEDAIIDYTKTIEINPNFELAYHNRGLALQKLNLNDEAELDFDKYLELKEK